MKTDKVASIFQKLLYRKQEKEQQAQESKKFIEYGPSALLENNERTWTNNHLPGKDNPVQRQRKA